jgi:hypothetical protein
MDHPGGPGILAPFSRLAVLGLGIAAAGRGQTPAPGCSLLGIQCPGAFGPLLNCLLESSLKARPHGWWLVQRFIVGCAGYPQTSRLSARELACRLGGPSLKSALPKRGYQERPSLVVALLPTRRRPGRTVLVPVLANDLLLVLVHMHHFAATTAGSLHARPVEVIVTISLVSRSLVVAPEIQPASGANAAHLQRCLGRRHKWAGSDTAARVGARGAGATRPVPDGTARGDATPGGRLVAVLALSSSAASPSRPTAT